MVRRLRGAGREQRHRDHEQRGRGCGHHPAAPGQPQRGAGRVAWRAGRVGRRVSRAEDAPWPGDGPRAEGRSRRDSGAVEKRDDRRPAAVLRPDPGAPRADVGTAGQVHRWHRTHGDLLIKPSFEPYYVRSYTHSIVLLFDRMGYVAVIRRGSDILATRRTDVWDLRREPLLSSQHARTRTRKVIRWRKPPWEAPQSARPALINRGRPDQRGGQDASRRAACRSSSRKPRTSPIPTTC